MFADRSPELPADLAKKPVPIDWCDLELAMDDWQLDHFWYLDTETGEAIFISEFYADDDMDEMKESIENDESGRYLDIPRADPGKDYRDMLDWAAAVESQRLHDELWEALDRNHPFRRFREVIEDYPTEQKEWLEFKRSRILQLAREWLDAERIEPIPKSG